MVNGLLGKKIGMTQLLQDDGSIVPVTVIQAGPCVVVQKKTRQTDGYDAVQLGFVEFVKPKSVNKPMAGHFKKSAVAPVKFVREMAIKDETGANPGDKVMVDIFAKDELVHVIGTSKGRGFAIREAPSFSWRPRHSRIHVPSGSRIDWVVGVPLSRSEGNAYGRTFGKYSRDGAEPARRANRSGQKSLVCAWGRARTIRRVRGRGEVGKITNGNCRNKESKQ